MSMMPPRCPSAIATATCNAWLDERPAPMGMSVLTRPVNPSLGCISATTPATYFAHDGSTCCGSSISNGRSTGSGSSNDVRRTRSPPRVPSISVYRSMAIGITRPPV